MIPHQILIQKKVLSNIRANDQINLHYKNHLYFIIFTIDSKESIISHLMLEKFIR
jgi:hypothetical protein